MSETCEFHVFSHSLDTMCLSNRLYRPAFVIQQKRVCIEKHVKNLIDLSMESFLWKVLFLIGEVSTQHMEF